jgi:hypothetical protein
MCAGFTLLCAATTSAQTRKPQQIGSFHVTIRADAMSDADRSSILTIGADGSASIAWKCMDDGLNVVCLFGKYLMGDNDYIQVEYRFPSQTAIGTRWDLSTSHEAAFLSMENVEAFTAQSLQAATVTLRVTDRDGETITDRFSLNGLAAALKQLPCAARKTGPR